MEADYLKGDLLVDLKASWENVEALFTHNGGTLPGKGWRKAIGIYIRI